MGFARYDNYTPAYLDSDPVRARLGVNGLVTSSFALLAMAGWGSSFYLARPNVNPQQFDSVLAQVELKWFITPNPSSDPAAATLGLSSLALGFTRDFYNSYLGDYYTRDRGYLSLTHSFSGRFLVVADAGLAALEYPTVYANRATAAATAYAPFTVVHPDATLFGEYRVADSFGINTTLRYTANLTDVVIAGDHLGWKRFEAFLGVRWFM